jgi:hypothetical protein
VTTDHRRWTARWLRLQEGRAPQRRLVVAFRRGVDLDGGPPAAVPVRVWADGRYRLWVNGTRVGEGPARAHPTLARADRLDLAPHLRPGSNELAVLVWRDADAVPWWAPPRTLLTRPDGGGWILDGHAGTVDLGTGPGWWRRRLHGLDTGPPPEPTIGRGVELLEAAVLRPSWTVDDPDPAQGWEPAPEADALPLGDPGLQPSPPTFPFGALPVHPVSPPTERWIELAPVGPGLWDAGEVVVGTLEVDLDAGGAGDTTVSLRTSEYGDGPAGRAERQYLLGLDVRPDPAGPATVESLDRYGLRRLRVTGPGATLVRGVRVRERTHPVTGTARFTCDDDLLERVWHAGRRTVTLCSLDAYVDCPSREQRAWVGDMVVHQRVDLTTNEDWTLARWAPRLCATPRPDGMLPMAVCGDIDHVDLAVIPDWALHWVHAVWNLYRYLGDPAEIAGLLGVVEGVLRWFEPYLDDEGCLDEVPGWVLIDWAAVRTEGVCAALNGLWGRALREFAEMAAWLGDRGRAGWAAQRHARLAAGFERLWDPRRGCYVDSWRGGRRHPAVSQHAQAAAIVGGLVPPDRYAQLVEVCCDEARLVHAAYARPDGPADPGSELPLADYLGQARPDPWWDVATQVVRAQPFFRYVVHDALAAAGAAERIAPALRDWAWLLERCPTSLSETFYAGTTCHGWSATPTADAMTRVLGVGPAAPGFTAAALAPAPGPLRRAEGAVPTPSGPLAVRISDGEVEVDSPLALLAGGRRLPPGTHRIELHPPA